MATKQHSSTTVPLMDTVTRDQSRVRQTAIATAMHTIGWPAAVLLVLIMYYERRSFESNPAEGLALGGAISAAVIFGGIVLGLIAHQLFSRSTISVNRMAFCLAILFDLVVLGWLIVIINESS